MHEDQLDLLSDPDANRIGKFQGPGTTWTPDTQRQAAVAAYPNTGTARRRVLDFIAHSAGATDEQIQEGLRMNPSTQRPRRVELVEGGWIEDSGRTRRTRSGTAAAVWVLTARGRAEWRP